MIQWSLNRDSVEFESFDSVEFESCDSVEFES